MLKHFKISKLLLISLVFLITMLDYSFASPELIKKLAEKNRAETKDLAKIIKAMNIKPGMTIVDIGAGIGVFAFPMASELKGLGKIYATDVRKDVLTVIEQKSRESRINTIQTVLVTSNGLDNFYKEHKFNIIFMCSVLSAVKNPPKYLNELKPSLLKETGRFYIVSDGAFSRYLNDELTDQKVIKTLRSANNQAITNRLSSGFQDYLNGINRLEFNKKKYQIPERYRKILTADLNRILTDKEDDFVYFEDKLLLKKGYKIGHKPFHKVQNLTTLLYYNLNKDLDLQNKQRSGSAKEQAMERRAQCTIRLLELSGYKFVSDHKDIISDKENCYFLEFKR